MADLKAKLKLLEGKAPPPNPLKAINPKVLILISQEEEDGLKHLKHLFANHDTFMVKQENVLLEQVSIYCEQRSITKVVSTNTSILSKLLDLVGTVKDEPSLSNYAGSVFTYKQLEFVFVPSLATVFTVPYGKFLCERFISKLLRPNEWLKQTPFKWSVCNASTISEAYEHLGTAYAISVDIETFKHNLCIRCVAYTGIYIDANGTFTTHTYVVPLLDPYLFTWVRKINLLKVRKIFQNGKYDNSYFIRFNATPTCWYWDTAHFFHSWYSELPKDLALLAAFFIREVVYWKDLSETTDLYEYYKYNAMDSWATSQVWIAQLIEAPQWAFDNYQAEFPLVYPCLLSELTGIQRDIEAINSARADIDKELSEKYTRLRTILNCPSFNVNSHPQVTNLRRILGSPDIPGGGEKELERMALRHPLNRIIVDLILRIRELIKCKGTYLRTDEDIKYLKDGITPAANAKGSKDLNGFWLYSLNPHFTDSGRLASGESAFWCGGNIQQTPREGPVKSTLVPPPGFRIAECDLKQAESRDTAFIVGSESYIKAVTGTRDFHSVNASAFFGVAYDSIFDDSTGKAKDKKLRDLAKRVNHGANYNMGAGVLVETMGEQKVWEASKILGLNGYTAKQTAEYLLERFHATYPELKKLYYPRVLKDIATSRLLVGATGWSRYCFGNPDKNKLDLNSYVAHVPQSLNAMVLNKAYMKVFYKIALPEAANFRLNAQIHDSILFCFREGRIDLAEKVKACMEIPVSVLSCDGKQRSFTVPADIKAGKQGVGVLRWSETE